MTCDEAKERAVIFRAALRCLVDAQASPDPHELLERLSQANAMLERYPFDPEAMTVLRKMAEENRVEKGLLDQADQRPFSAETKGD